MQLAFVPPAASPIRRQYLSLKHQHPDAILFFQLGDFYETFEDDARTVAEVCEVVLTSREMGRGERVPMAGVPVQAADAYIARLVGRGYHIAICDQIDQAGVGGRGSGVGQLSASPAPSRHAPSPTGLVARAVTRVITPGTLVDLPLLRTHEANYLAAIAFGRGRVGLAYAEVSTGEYACAEIDGADHREVATAELARVSPAECLVAGSPEGADPVPVGCPRTVDETLFSGSDAERGLCDHFGVASAAALGLADRPTAVIAAAAVLRYLGRTQPRAAAAIEHLRVYDARGHMVLDPATRSHLEITRGATGRREGSLLQVLDRTRTPMGARLLADWLGHPLLDRARILERLDAVTALLERSPARREAQELLHQLPDLARLAGRAAQRILTPREALALADGVTHAVELQRLMAGRCPGDARLAPLVSRVDPPLAVAEDVRATLADAPPAAFGEGVIRHGVRPELDELRSHSRDGRQWLLDLERRERERTGLKNLKVGYNRVFGYYLEVTAASLKQPLDYYRQQETGARTVGELVERLGYQRRQTLASVERFVTPELREHEVRQARSAIRMAELEREMYEQLCVRVAEHASRLASTAGALAELDVLASYAEVAHERRYVRPEILDGPLTEIVGGRHPVVEAALGWGSYVPSDGRLGTGDRGQGTGDRGQGPGDTVALTSNPRPLPADPRPAAPDPQSWVMLLTGPNMAGKTTYGRMVLLVGLMAQCGSFVPAERARLGLVDRVFLRSGAADDIAGGRSTFMVEMTETAAILRSVTPRSLAFFDEIGRGTSTFDGMAIARAVVEHLARPERGCRTIFSTHYHELAAIEDDFPAVRNYRMDVREAADQVYFMYRVVPGSANRSYGVHVARLAGLPPSVVSRASEVLASLEEKGAASARPDCAVDRTPSPLAGEGWGGGGENSPAPLAGEGWGRGEGPRPKAAAVKPPYAPVIDALAAMDPEHMTPLEALNALAQLGAEARGWLDEHE